MLLLMCQKVVVVLQHFLPCVQSSYSNALSFIVLQVAVAAIAIVVVVVAVEGLRKVCCMLLNAQQLHLVNYDAALNF